MKYNTRFNPTISNELHVGHLYTALVNCAEANRSGGKFIVRVDDTQKYWVHHLGQEMMNYFYNKYQKQISQFMHVDKWERQSSLPSVSSIIGYNEFLQYIPKEMWFHDQVADWVADPEMMMYPYAPTYTLEKVVWDFNSRINWLIRGEDLATETCLYTYFTEMLGLPRVRHTLIPRLRAADAISKTLKTYQLDKQIEKFGVEASLKYLKESCLVNPEGEFYVENIKWNPTVVGFLP